MGDVSTGSQESGLSNPAMKAAATTIGNQLNTQLQAGVKPYTGSLVPALSGQTSQGVSSLMGAAGNTGGLAQATEWNRNVVDAGGYNSALKSAQGGIEGYLRESQADAPGYAALRAKAGDDTLRDINALTTASGRFGSGSHIGKATQELGNVYAGMDMQNYENRLGRMLGGNQALAGIGQTAYGNAQGAAASLPGLYQAGLMPGQAMLQAGQTMDAYNTARAGDAARIFDATENAGWNTLQRGGSIFGGTAPVSGTTTTESQPWWKVGTGLGATALGFL